MSAIREEVKKIKDAVEKLLREDQKYRDSDRKLIARIWANTATIPAGRERKEYLKTKGTWFFLSEFAEGKYPNPESIRRCRQKLQEQNPELRGRSYKHRKKEADQMRDEIKNV